MPWSKSEKTLREQLVEARTKVHRQLEILKGNPASGDRWGDNRKVIRDLERELSELNGALANLAPDDG